MSSERIKNPYTYPHLKQGRGAMVDYIVANGGYSRNRDITCPIEFNVAADYADFEFDHLWEKFKDNLEFVPAFKTPEDMALYYRVALREYEDNKEYLFDWGIEEARRSVKDDDTYSMLWDGTMLKVQWEFHGSCGKHLCLVEYEGEDFSSISSEELGEALLRQTHPDGIETSAFDTLRRGFEWDWNYDSVVRLYKFVRQCAQDFTPRKASEEVEYQGAWQFFNNVVNPAFDAALKERKEHEEVVEAANILKQSLVNFGLQAVLPEFRVLCHAAGILEEEV